MFNVHLDPDGELNIWADANTSLPRAYVEKLKNKNQKKVRGYLFPDFLNSEPYHMLKLK